jgi:hypothetical protein
MKSMRQEIQLDRSKLLSRGGWGNADVFLSDAPAEWAERSEPVVVKDFAPRPFWLRWTWGVWMIRRELAAYRALAGLSSVPRVVGVIDVLAFALEYRPGERLSRALAGVVPPQFVDELEDAIASMHVRGVVHLDLRHRSNILAGDDGHPVLLDFASSLVFRPGSFAYRFIRPWFARVDLAALEKWRVRVRG